MQIELKIEILKVFSLSLTVNSAKGKKDEKVSDTATPSK
jgi:hypothetical protein